MRHGMQIKGEDGAVTIFPFEQVVQMTVEELPKTAAPRKSDQMLGIRLVGDVTHTIRDKHEIEVMLGAYKQWLDRPFGTGQA